MTPSRPSELARVDAAASASLEVRSGGSMLAQLRASEPTCLRTKFTCPASVDAPNDEMSELTCMERL